MRDSATVDVDIISLSKTRSLRIGAVTGSRACLRFSAASRVNDMRHFRRGEFRVSMNDIGTSALAIKRSKRELSSDPLHLQIVNYASRRLLISISASSLRYFCSETGPRFARKNNDGQEEARNASSKKAKRDQGEKDQARRA